LASDAALEVAVSKERTADLAASLGIDVPQSVAITDPSQLRAALAEVGLPAVVKPTRSWAVDSEGVGTRLSSTLAQTADDAAAALDWMLASGGSALVQRWLPGVREAVTLFYAHGRFWARFAQISHREWPTLGGVSALCESVPLRSDTTHSAERLIEAMDLEGCAMVEFRRDSEGRAVLMEVNPRMGASVGLAVRCGVNFPQLLYAWGMGEPIEQMDHYRVGKRLRWLVGEIWYVKSAFNGPSPETAGRAEAVAKVISDLVLRPGRVDGFYLTDPWPALVEMRAAGQAYGLPAIRQWLRS
jgi:predicted ATP-grasp superfamily ATP-dependent carboligase